MKQKIAIFGAGGKMGCRITDNLLNSAHDMFYVEDQPCGHYRTRVLRSYRDGIPIAAVDPQRNRPPAANR